MNIENNTFYEISSDYSDIRNKDFEEEILSAVESFFLNAPKGTTNLQSLRYVTHVFARSLDKLAASIMKPLN